MNTKYRITVIGSSNTDMVIKSEKLPAPGETILGGNFLMNAGGKGANQAVACCRLGGNTTFITKVGNDLFGEQAKQQFIKEGIESKFVFIDPIEPSGIALIMVDDKGENSISVALGANETLCAADLDLAKEQILNSEFVLMQLETPVELVEYIANLCNGSKTKIILNPAPAQNIREELFNSFYIITPNETEAEILTGLKINDIQSAEQAAAVLLKWGVENVIITLGSKGALFMNKNETILVPGNKVKALDATAAGDTFNGALVSALADGKKIPEAIVFANKAASISVTRMGAQSSIPFKNEII